VQFWVNLLGTPFADFVPVARRADELGYAGVAVSDHLVVPEHIESRYPGGNRPWGQHTDWPDAWVAIGAMAAVTTSLRFVTNVSIVALRHPLVTAKAVATAAGLAPGRVVLGVGVGWMREEYDALGSRFDDRGARTDEAIAIMRTAWTDGVVEHRGRHYGFEAVHVRPVPPAPVPIWVGGESEAALRRAAERGDGWISGRPLGTALELVADVRGRRRRAERPDEPFAIAVSSPSDLGEDDVARAVEAGVDHLKVAPWDGLGGDVTVADRLRALDRFAERHLR
jgi:probable F420-dependent oxidoreductase